MTEIIDKGAEVVETPTPKIEVPPKKEAAPSQAKEPKTRIEKLRHTKASIEKQIADEEAANGGIVISDEDDDDKPLTKRDLKNIQRDEAKKTALSMANEIEDETDRSKVIEVLETRILPSGNPEKDLQLAKDAVFSEKNRQVAAATAKNGRPSTQRSGGGAPPKTEDTFVATDNELAAAAMVGKKTPADIKAFVLKARAKEQQ